MSACDPIPCPDVEGMDLTISALCNCDAGPMKTPMGNLDCPVHGVQVAAYWRGALAALAGLRDRIYIDSRALTAEGGLKAKLRQEGLESLLPLLNNDIRQVSEYMRGSDD